MFDQATLRETSSHWNQKSKSTADLGGMGGLGDFTYNLERQKTKKSKYFGRIKCKRQTL